MNEKTLSHRQRRFVDEFLIDLNATQAAIRVGYSRRTVREIAHEHLTKPHIRAAIAKATQARSERIQIDQDRVLQEIGRIAFVDPRRVFDEGGNLLDAQDWPEDVASAVSSLKVREIRRDDGTVTTVREIKFWDKGRQLELACRHLGLLSDRVSVRVEGSIGERMARIRKRAVKEEKMSPDQKGHSA